MFIIIELKDHEDKSHDSVKFELQDQTTIKELQNKIHSSFRIELESQRIFDSNGRRIDLLVGSLEEAGIKCDETLILKHALLKMWSTYLKQIEEIRDVTTSGMTNWRKEIALEARKFLSPLMDANFFIVYPDFIQKRVEIDKEINFLVYNTKKYMRRAVEKYFNSLFDGHIVELLEKPKELEGLQLGFFVFVKDAAQGPINSYYAKITGNIPRAEFAPEWKPNIDLAELFVYQLFKLIGIGASEVHIIPDSVKSGCVYLATKLMDNFYTASGKSVDIMILEDASLKVSKKEIVINEEVKKQLEILSSLLCLEDLTRNNGNYGVVEKQVTEGGSVQELRIVDFRVNAMLKPKISVSEERIPELENCLKRWDMLSNIEEAKELIEQDKTIKVNPNVNWSIFNSYVMEIKKTLQDFINNRKFLCFS